MAGVELLDARPLAGGDICAAWQARAAQQRVFAKTLRGAPSGFFAAEAAGLDRLRVDGGPPVPEVVAVDAGGLVLEWIDSGPPSREAAARFGRRLAALHAHPAGRFGAADSGFIGTLPLDNRPLERAVGSWPQFYIERRIRPYLDALEPAERRDVEALCRQAEDVAGPPEPPATIHGDLWSGNLVWAAGEVWLVDAASAHGGHRETDLAMLQLFGAPHLAVILDAYQDVTPLAAGWQQRVPLHQLHPLLVHATLFGGGYGARAARAARAMLAVR